MHDNAAYHNMHAYCVVCVHVAQHDVYTLNVSYNQAARFWPATALIFSTELHISSPPPIKHNHGSGQTASAELIAE